MPINIEGSDNQIHLHEKWDMLEDGSGLSALKYGQDRGFQKIQTLGTNMRCMSGVNEKIVHHFT